jgi:flagellar basal-body rod protein FlgC
MFASMDISTSGMVAQRARLNAISSNIANMSTQLNEAGENVPYQPKFTVFQTVEGMGEGGAAGVRVASVETDPIAPLLKYEPNNPLADPKTGMVAYPNINMMQEFVDSLEASRAYEANVGALDVTKELTQQTLRILA